MIDLVETEQGGVVILQPPVIVSAPLTASEMAQAQIDALERQYLMPRVVRESLIAQAEERGAALGYTPAQLAVKNKGYAGLKALDTQIAALRAQL
ncbi:hypothetical protein J2W88_003919 [Acidovorax delafieldii]|uniref:Uncharacterized protein n=1 Tax=Acidovorax delafieldii TaxID=47920 RepID=A0AAJ2F2D5_ACIDE|nr:hypothetical protein [Acidovorax delafieldii]MDR6768615.1 hypothetical protein [Acidovorax delafieldii]MDR6837330.1 hypothetical protein [Acidovorax delafieldii]MDR7366821.1 hypothetical protein [Acidovorax delafieldii]